MVFQSAFKCFFNYLTDCGAYGIMQGVGEGANILIKRVSPHVDSEVVPCLLNLSLSNRFFTTCLFQIVITCLVCFISTILTLIA